jgi:hypothetical protein
MTAREKRVTVRLKAQIWDRDLRMYMMDFEFALDATHEENSVAATSLFAFASI